MKILSVKVPPNTFPRIWPSTRIVGKSLKDLQLYPYRIQIKHNLPPFDFEKCLMMCRWFENKIVDLLDGDWFSDEAHFWLCEHVISNNWVYWGFINPRRGASETLVIFEMQGVCGHLQTRNYWTILGWKRRRGSSHCHNGVLYWCAKQILWDTRNTSPSESKCAMVSIRKSNSAYRQQYDKMARRSIS